MAGHEVGFDTLLMYAWRDREVVMDILALLTGNRVNYGINTIGGVRRDITPAQMKEVATATDTLEERTKAIGADDFLVKPFEPQELIAKIRKFLG